MEPEDPARNGVESLRHHTLTPGFCGSAHSSSQYTLMLLVHVPCSVPTQLV